MKVLSSADILPSVKFLYFVKGPTGQDWPESGIIGKPMASTYLAIDFKICIFSLIFNEV
jgi:hypothetical protein